MAEQPKSISPPQEARSLGDRYRIHLVAGNANPALAQAVSDHLRIPLTPCHVTEKASGEVIVKVDPSLIAGGDVFIIQPVCNNGKLNINEAMLELLFLIRRLKLAYAARVTAVVPFFAYARQDRKCDLRSPLSAAAVAKMIEQMGVDRVVTMDLHAAQIQGCFNNRAPLDNLAMDQEFGQYLRSQPWYNADRVVVVSPDAGGVARAHKLADTIGVHRVVTIVKRRAQAGVIDTMQTVGDVKGFDCVILDDMVDTAGTLCVACSLLKKLGATRVVACITHGIMTDPACARVNACNDLEELIVSDSLPQHLNAPRCEKLQVLSLAPTLARAVLCYHNESSVSSLFDSPQSVVPIPRTTPKSSTMGDEFPADSCVPPVAASAADKPKAKEERKE